MEVIESFLSKQALVKKWAEGVLGYELSSEDLWEQLKSGVDLCRLMLKLKEGCVFAIVCGAREPKWRRWKAENRAVARTHDQGRRLD